jgi:hypothetical protein
VGIKVDRLRCGELSVVENLRFEMGHFSNVEAAMEGEEDSENTMLDERLIGRGERKEE